ncbi:MAG: glycosyltransferase family 2 protein [Vicinamibacterales bacterium]
MTAPTRRSVGIAIVNWNAGSQLSDCVRSIAATAWDTLTLSAVVIVDNASADGSLDNLPAPAELPLRIIRNDSNRGFAAACNQAAATIEADYLLFLNPDTLLEPGSIPAAIAWLDHPAHVSYGIAGIQLLDEQGRISCGCARFPTVGSTVAKTLGLDRLLPTVFASYLMEDWGHTESRDVDHVIGAFYLVRHDVFRALRGFDEAFFVYFEDLDFSRRAASAGWRSRYLTETRAFHKGGGTSDQIKSLRLFYSLQSRLVYARKHFTPLGARSVALATLAIEPLIRLAACAIGGSATGLRETLGAYRMLWAASRGLS